VCQAKTTRAAEIPIAAAVMQAAGITDNAHHAAARSVRHVCCKNNA
jgi:hypothetical protein